VNSSIKNIIELLTKKGFPFVIYRLPNTEEPVLIVQKSLLLNHTSIEEIDKIEGFITTPFNAAKTDVLSYLKPDFIISNNEIPTELNNMLLNKNDIIKKNIVKVREINKENYINTVDYLINKINTKEIKKVVFSRIIANDLNSNFSPTELFNKLCITYSSAFVYLLNSEETGMWTGASPETLLKKEKNSIETMAVAGTRLLLEYKKNKNWEQKEKEEQNLVSIYIKSLLSELGIKDYEVDGPKTIAAGNLVHLKTNFTIKLDKHYLKCGKIIKGLHPTPAVCGLPKAEAYHLIEKAEPHNRKLYTGFLGPWNLKKTSHLFVNLRCAEISQNKIFTYVGGGLTADSQAYSEWQETENKSRTLLSVVEKL
jgi:isochorismate synthase